MPSRRFIRVLKDRLGHYARPEGRDEPFRARAFAEPAPFAALTAGFQRTGRLEPLPQIRPNMPQKRPNSFGEPASTCNLK